MSNPPANVEPFRITSLGRHSLIYGSGLILTKLVSFVMLPIYTRLLTPADYGVIALIVMTFEVVTIIAGSRIAIGLFHFYQKEDDERGRRKVLSTAFVVLTSTYTMAAVLTVAAAPLIAGFVFGEGDQFVTYVRIAAVTMAFEGLFFVPIGLLQLEERSTRYVLINLVRLVLQVILNLIFLIPLKMGVMGVLLAGLVTNAVVGIALSVQLLTKVGVGFDGPTARSFLRFGIPLVFMQIATFIATFGDRYFLNQAADTSQVGLYSLAYQFGFLVVNLGFAPFNRVWDPQRFAIAKRPDRDEIFARVFLYMNVLLLSVALGIALFGGDVIRVMANEEFHAAAAYVPFLAAAYVFHSWGSFLNLGIYLTERTGYFALANWVSAIVALVGYVTLIPIWFAWGATIATLASLMVRCWLAHVFSQRLWRVEYRWGAVFRLVALTLVVGLASSMVRVQALPMSIAVHAALFCAYGILAWVLPILGDDERLAVRRLLGRYVARWS